VKFGVYGIGQLIDCCMCGGYLYLVALFHLVFCLSVWRGHLRTHPCLFLLLWLAFAVPIYVDVFLRMIPRG